MSFEWNQLLHAREPSESGASIIFHLDQSHNLTIFCFQFASRLPISAPNTSRMPLLSVSASSLTPTGQRGAGSPTNRRRSWTQGHGWQTGCRVRGATVLLIESSSAGPCKQQIDMQIMRVQNVTCENQKGGSSPPTGGVLKHHQDHSCAGAPAVRCNSSSDDLHVVFSESLCRSRYHSFVGPFKECCFETPRMRGIEKLLLLNGTAHLSISGLPNPVQGSFGLPAAQKVP